MRASGPTHTFAAMIDAAEAVLVADSERVEMVLSNPGPDRYRVASHRGWCELVRTPAGVEVAAEGGENPIADQATDRFLGLAAEQAARFPSPAENAYPYAGDQIAQLFDHPAAPDLVAVRTPAFHVNENLGEHGSLGAVQARAGFVASGAGIVGEGIVDRHLRAVDVAPTVAAVLGCEAGDDGRLLSGQDGDVDQRLLTGEIAARALVFLLDGLNANLLVDAIEAGEVPTIAALVSSGVCYREGSLASLPTVTVPNHTTLLTGAHPGHHGVLSNSWFDRARGQAPNLFDYEQMIRTQDWIDPGVETLFETVRRNHPDSFNAATYEYADRGADYSTYGELRAGRRPPHVPRRDQPVPDATERWIQPDTQYHFMSRIDTSSARQACELLDPSGPLPTPTFTWVTFNVTDAAGHHAGPHGDETRAALRDSDARVAKVLDAADQAGTLADTAVFVVADHGMEQTDPAVDGHYRSRLDAAAIRHRDLDNGLIYLQ